MTIVRFSTAEGEHVGDVRIAGETLEPDPAVTDIVRSWLGMRRTAAGFVGRYTSWSNGYLVSAIVED